MIFTINARIGDTVMLLPVASWYYKKFNEKIQFVLSSNGPYNDKLKEVIEYQSFCSGVNLVNIEFNAFTHWKFDPQDFNISGNYYNFGFWNYPPPDTWLPDFYASKYDFGVDEDYILEYPNIDVPVCKNAWIEAANYRNQYGRIEEHVPQPNLKLNETDGFFYNINIAIKSTNFYSCGGGFAALLELCQKKCIHIQTKYEYKEGHARIFRDKTRPDYKIKHDRIFI